MQISSSTCLLVNSSTIYHYYECRVVAGLWRVSECQVPALYHHHLTGKRQTDAGTGTLGGEKRHEHLACHFG